MATKIGRPTKYTDKLSDKICALLSQGKSLRTVCKSKALPSRRTIFRWLRTMPTFCHQYARAKQESSDALADEMLDIADDGTNDYMEENGKNCKGYQLKGEHVQRSRLRIDTRKFLMVKQHPKKYGDRQAIDLKAAVMIGEKNVEDMTEEELQSEIDRDD